MGVWRVLVFALTALAVILAIVGGVEVLRRLRGRQRLIEELEKARRALLEDAAEPPGGDDGGFPLP